MFLEAQAKIRNYKMSKRLKFGEAYQQNLTLTRTKALSDFLPEQDLFHKLVSHKC
jgi:hypothetical protein